MSETIAASNLEDSGKVNAVVNAVKNLNLVDQLKTKLNIRLSEKKKTGRSLTSLETRQLVWDFWHSSSSPSTDTTRPAHLKVSPKPKIQTNLSFNTLFRIKRNNELYQSVWYITSNPFKALYQNFISTNPHNIVSHGTLNPFHVHAATEKDIEMCLCKIHLHARRAVDTLFKLCTKQNIPLEFKSYTTLFEFLRNCPESNNDIYLLWDCTPNKKNCL